MVLAVAPVARGLLGTRRPIGRSGRILGGLGLGVLVFVLLGTLARQYLSYGADVDADPHFGGFGRLAADLMGPRALALDVAGVILLVAVLAVVLAARVFTAAGRDEAAGEGES
jgi:NADH:ubiquinone oxidoreductase subunit 6 (subunit J)